MNTQLDQVLKELEQESDDLQYITNQLNVLAEYNKILYATIKNMARVIAVAAYPNFYNYVETEQNKIIFDITRNYIKQEEERN